MSNSLMIVQFLFDNAAGVFLALFIFSFFVAFLREEWDHKSPVRWIDMLVDKRQNRLSLTKFWQFIGSTVFVWVVITMTMAGTITPEILGIVGAFLLGGFGWSTYMKNKSPDKDAQ